MAVLCKRCGFPTAVGSRIKSRHTGAVYCADICECERREENHLTVWELNWLIAHA